MAFRNMLRSEHIPYNFFIPLKLNSNQIEVLSFFKKLFDRDDLLTITKFEIEWAPDSKYTMQDKTSFDVYIQFDLQNDKTLGVGIEIKFTEKSYPYTAMELSRLKKEVEAESPYFKIWNNKKISVYEDNSYNILGEKMYKQFFRNHLLGLSMINNNNLKIKIDEFISVHLFPEANTYQKEKAEEYNQKIRLENRRYFISLTFEKFIDEGEKIFNASAEKKWLNYLKDRYIVN